MRTTLSAILILACAAASASAQQPGRPKVPEARATASLGVSLGERPAVVSTGPLALTASAEAASAAGQPFSTASATGRTASPLPSSSLSARTGVSAMASRDVAARLRQPETLDGDEIDGGRFIRLVLSCEDDRALRDLLTASGLTLRDDGEPRKLPDFFTAVGCNSRTDFSREDVLAMEKITPPSGVRVLRFVDRSGAAADYAAAHGDEKFIIIAEPSGLSVKALKALAGANIVAVIVGHYHAADLRPEDYATAAAETLAAAKAIRLVSDAPVLLAVSATNWRTRRTEKSWPHAFGDDLAGFDGWAVYNLAQFPAILEAPSNPRTLVMDRLGLREKPCLLIEFMGTRYDYGPQTADYIRKVWRAKAPLLVKALKEQRWRGLVVWSANIDDAILKAEALRGM